MRYLTEINEKMREIPSELMENPEIRKAVNQLEESAFTEAQLLGYEKFWDIVSVEKTLIGSAERKGEAIANCLQLESDGSPDGCHHASNRVGPFRDR